MTVAVHDGRHVTAVWPGPPREGVRRRDRRRLDDDRRPPGRPRRRLGPRLGGRDEPADPLRRGPHEPRLVRDDARRRRARDDPRGPDGAADARRSASPTRPASNRSTSSRSRSSATRSCITSCSASTRSRWARRRSRWRPTAPSASARPSSACPPIPGARVYVLPCIAGHVGADTAGVILAEAPAPGDERGPRSSSTSAPTPRSCSATRDRLLAASSPTGPAFEGAQISGGQRAIGVAEHDLGVGADIDDEPHLARCPMGRLARRPRPCRPRRDRRCRDDVDPRARVGGEAEPVARMRTARSMAPANGAEPSGIGSMPSTR